LILIQSQLNGYRDGVVDEHGYIGIYKLHLRLVIEFPEHQGNECL